MESLFDPAALEETRRRILALTPASRRQWGSMTLPQTLNHCTNGIGMAMGAIRVKRAPFPFNVVGLLLKPIILRAGQPMRRNSPSAPELFPQPVPADFDHERSQLLTALDNFAEAREAGCTPFPHPFLGTLKPQQWAALMYKHLDHHLRQFGA